jgi:copper oxidase (laccase) domain-containing protein
MTITVKDISEESLKEIVKVIGPARFSQFFEVKRSFKPNSRFNQEQFTAFTQEQRQRLAQAGVKQNKPSIRVK